jgi:hypothetical protein
MSELEQRLNALGAALEWPATPSLGLPVDAARRRRAPLLAVALALLAALGIALAVPGARSAILHALHLEGVTVVRVDVLPPAEERSLGEGLGSRVTPVEAEAVLGRPFVLPAAAGTPTLRVGQGVVSTILAGPVLLSELRNEAGPEILKKLAGGATSVEGVEVGGAPGLWLSGAPHVYLAPGAPPRLAGDVLLWTNGGILYRLEGPKLTKELALELARKIAGT